jgi:hypothetical protein
MLVPKRTFPRAARPARLVKEEAMTDRNRRTVLATLGTLGTLFGGSIVGISAQAGQGGGRGQQQMRRDARENALDDIVGTWVQNMEKSHYDPGPPLKSQVRQFDYTHDGLLLSHYIQENQEGIKFAGHWMAPLDGSQWPEYFRNSGSTPALVVSPRKTDQYHMENTAYQNGRVITRSTWEISKDGKTLTQVSRAFAPDGKVTAMFTAVFEKQG